MMGDVVPRLREFIENEMRSCSMDIGGITPKYVQGHGEAESLSRI